VESVIPDRGGGEQDGIKAFSPLKSSNQVPGGQEAAVTNLLFRLPRPAPEDRGPGQVDKDVMLGSLFLPGTFPRGVAFKGGLRSFETFRVRTVTSSPLAMSCLVMFIPTKPDPPVMNTFMMISSFHILGQIYHETIEIFKKWMVT
jgi:hypothetical protein